ncbi:alpha beta-hydrolase [Crucibulum laeve]|uniref:Alpha beta-hydrolase n=1 Tax=Crucibulum laeve TaxID=68775 RepID=A0A5C3MF73_9AGAR|nr:alpha beta-hydrolase [Crucibulum laeve]
MFFLALSAFSLLVTRCLAENSILGTFHRRSYFYVGQSYVPQGNSSIAFGQMYVEHLVPSVVSQPFPLLFIHGRGMTGTNFLNTPDGRLGWADYFLSKGYEVYIVDQPSRGRSAWQQNIDDPQVTLDTLAVESRFTAVERFNLWPQASLHTKWPGNGSVGDPIFDEFFASTMPSINSDVATSVRIKAAGPLVLDKINRPVILVTHSQSGQQGWILGDSRPSLVKAIVALEPTGPPFSNVLFPPFDNVRPFGITEIPVAYSPALNSATDLQKVVVSSNPALNFTCFKQASPPRTLTNLSKLPVLVVTSESSYHAVYDSCTVDYLKQAGVSVEHINLGDVGIHGNGHMMFLELNSLQIAETIVEKWISKISRK